MTKTDAPKLLPEVTAIVEVGKFRDNGISNHSSEYENIGSFHNLSKFRALYFLKLCISRGTLMHSRGRLSHGRELPQTTTGISLARRSRASSLLVWLNMRLSHVRRAKNGISCSLRSAELIRRVHEGQILWMVAPSPVFGIKLALVRNFKRSP